MTLAVCKPQIRRTAKENDLVVGLSPKAMGNELVYAMIVGSILTFAEYYQDEQFSLKKPDMNHPDPRVRVGDNFYQPLDEDHFLQLPSVHSNSDGSEHELYKERDLSGIFVLVATQFYYFGRQLQSLPTDLDFLQIGRGHRLITDLSQVNMMRRFLDKKETGVHAEPRNLGKY